jgi:hypothetical protein
MGSRPYTRRLIVAVVVVAALLAVVVLVPDRPRPSVNVPPGSVFGSKSAPYEYYDPDSLSWRDFVYVGRPVYQSRLYLMTVWAPGEHGCYVLSPADEWAAVPDLRDQVVDLMSRFEKRSYSYDPDTLANLPTFSATCAPGQDALQIRLDDLAETYLGLTGMYGMEVTIARGEDPSVYGIHWCPSSGHEDGTCYQVGARSRPGPILDDHVCRVLGLGFGDERPVWCV